MAITTLEEYLREFSVEIGDRILTSFPALHGPGDPVSPILGKLLRKPFAAQEVAIAGAVARLRQADSVACIAEMGTGKTLMAMSIAHVFSAGRPYGCLFVVPPQLLQKTAREILQTIPGARVYVIDSLRSQRPSQAGPHGVNEFRLRNGRIIRDGVHTTLTEMRLRGKHKSAWDRWVAEHGPGPHYVICGRDRAKLGAFWRPSFQVARCGNHNGAIVNPDSGRPIVFDDERLLRDDFDRQERFAETLESVRCAVEKRPNRGVLCTARCGRLMDPESGATHQLSSSAVTSSRHSAPPRYVSENPGRDDFNIALTGTFDGHALSIPVTIPSLPVRSRLWRGSEGGSGEKPGSQVNSSESNRARKSRSGCSVTDTVDDYATKCHGTRYC